VRAEHLRNRRGFRAIAERCRCGVRVEILNAGRRQMSVLQRRSHRPRDALAVCGRRGDVVRVRGHAAADQFGDHERMTSSGVLEILEDQDAGAFADHEAVAALVPGRLARSGASLRIDSARIAANPAMPNGVILASVPPQIMASA